uniref:Ovule protein n=1 Tax=Heterorhabditis bacteriophora TaxID=37862 RepID=A0A1I7WSV6_HETBA
MNGADSSVGEGHQDTSVITDRKKTKGRSHIRGCIMQQYRSMCLSEHTTNNKKASTSLQRVSTSCKKRINNFTTRTISGSQIVVLPNSSKYKLALNSQ